MLSMIRAKFAVLILTLLLAGCGEVSRLVEKDDADLLLSQAEAELQLAGNSQSPEKEYHQIQAADMFYRAGLLKRTTRILEAIQSDELNNQQFLDYTLLYIQVALEEDDYFQVRALSEARRLLDDWDTIPVSQQLQILQQRADIQALLGDEQAAINSYIALAAMQIDPADKTATHSKLWSVLLRLPHQQLMQETENNQELAGWLVLARTFNQNQGNIRQQLAAYNDWRSLHTSHPAAKYPPDGISSLQSMSADLPQRVALLLPLKGDLGQAGNTIQSGFLAAWFENHSNYADAPSVRFYDTAGGESIDTIYQRALEEGAELIIGPLDKGNLQQLNAGTLLSVPTIALNYLENPADGKNREQQHADSDASDRVSATDSKNNHLPEDNSGIDANQPQEKLVQMGLLVEDEAEQAALRAWQEGKRHALIIAAQTQWAERASKAFTEKWLQLGGKLEILPPYLNDQRDFAPLLKPVLHIDQSLSRNQRLERLLGKDLAFTPRKRQDVDMVFLIAYPDQARQIKPTLNFLFASDLDVYATSHIYNGTEDSNRNRDLNNIRFSALPWTLPGQLADNLKPDEQIAASYRQLYALGMDAYLIHQWAPQLKQNLSANLAGTTGTLFLDANNRIHRQLPWAVFRNGQVQPATILEKN